MIYALGDIRPRFLGDYWIADGAVVGGNVVLHPNVSIWFGAVVRGDNDLITIGENSNVQDGSVLHTDPGIPLTIGRGVTIGHMVMLHGCTIGDNSLIGIGALVMNRAVVGKNCIVGAKTLVSEGKVIPDGSLVVGSPGRIIRSLSPEEIAGITANTEHYLDHLQRYKAQMRVL